jgi:hypothetical protein
MDDALYFPIHRAKKGEITAAGHLSPYALTRVRPTFEVQKPGEEDDTPLQEYLGGVAFDLSESWDHRYPLFADFPHWRLRRSTAEAPRFAFRWTSSTTA